MELLETQDPERRKLLESSERHRRELEKEVKDISERTERVLTNAIVVGGVMALAYFAVSQFTKRKSKKKKLKKERKLEEGTENIVAAQALPEEASAAPSLLADIGNKVINQATMILIELAREKVLEYLQSRKKDDLKDDAA